MFYLNDSVFISALSDALNIKEKYLLDDLVDTLKSLGIKPVLSKYLFGNNSIFASSGKDKADELMYYYKDRGTKAIFDISGGNIANEILEYLDYTVISDNPKPFFGYSDLTTVINAVYQKCNVKGYLYQVRNLISEYKENQISDFKNSFFYGEDDILKFKYKFLKGDNLSGKVIGGNIRCLLKLAGSEYMPDFNNKILFLESRSGNDGAIFSYLNQLKYIGAFDNIKGLLLGRFSELKEEGKYNILESMVLDITKELTFSVAITDEIGHNKNSKCIIIGEEINLIK